MSRKVNIVYSSKFKSDYKKVIKQHKDLPLLLEKLLSYLKDGMPIPEKFRDHQLSGNLIKYRRV